MIWSGSIATIPNGFSICDGSNGTPDLRSRFVYGAGGTYTKTAWAYGWNNVSGHFTPGVTGGEEQHIISIAEMPSHNHSTNWREYNEDGQGNNSMASGEPSKPEPSFFTLSTEYTGGNQPHNIMPRFISLAYIMKL